MPFINQTRAQKPRYLRPGTKAMTSIVFFALLLAAWLFGLLAMSGVASATAPALSTNVVIQNMDAGRLMNAKLTYYSLGGQLLFPVFRTVLPNRSVTVAQPDEIGLGTNFTGTAVIDADEPFAAVVHEYSGKNSDQGKNFRSDTYTSVPNVDLGTTLVLPQVTKGVVGLGGAVTWNSTIVIQNPNSGSAGITIKYKQSTGEEYTHSGISIPANSSLTLEVQNDSALSGVTTLFGIGRITSTLPIAVLVYQNTAYSLSIYPAFSSTHAGTTLYLPQLLKYVNDSTNTFSWSTGIAATSMDGQPITITVTYIGNDGTTYTENKVASPLANVDLRSSPALAGLTSFNGSGILTADRPIVAVVSENTTYVSTLGLRSSAWRAFPSTSAGTRVYLPMLSKYAFDTTTGITKSTAIQGLLVGTAPTTVTLTYYLSNGMTQQRTQAVSPTAPMILLDMRYDSALANGTVASGVLTTDPPQPIVAIVNIPVDTTILGDAYMTYEGVGQAPQE